MTPFKNLRNFIFSVLERSLGPVRLPLTVCFTMIVRRPSPVTARKVKVTHLEVASLPHHHDFFEENLGHIATSDTVTFLFRLIRRAMSTLDLFICGTVQFLLCCRFLLCQGCTFLAPTLTFIFFKPFHFSLHYCIMFSNYCTLILSNFSNASEWYRTCSRTYGF